MKIEDMADLIAMYDEFVTAGRRKAYYCGWAEQSGSDGFVQPR